MSSTKAAGSREIPRQDPGYFYEFEDLSKISENEFPYTESTYPNCLAISCYLPHLKSGIPIANFR